MFSFRYYDLDAYHRKMMEKEKKKGLKTLVTERTVFNDEEQRRYVKINMTTYSSCVYDCNILHSHIQGNSVVCS